MSEIIFKDPPVPKKGRGSGTTWVERLSPLIEHPGRWALVHRYPGRPNGAGSAVSHMRMGRYKIPEGQWEFAARTVDGDGEVYARYLNGAA